MPAGDMRAMPAWSDDRAMAEAETLGEKQFDLRAMRWFTWGHIEDMQNVVLFGQVSPKSSEFL